MAAATLALLSNRHAAIQRLPWYLIEWKVAAGRMNASDPKNGRGVFLDEPWRTGG
jgi:hypothetical protein